MSRSPEANLTRALEAVLECAMGQAEAALRHAETLVASARMIPASMSSSRTHAYSLDTAMRRCGMRTGHSRVRRAIRSCWRRSVSSNDCVVVRSADTKPCWRLPSRDRGCRAHAPSCPPASRSSAGIAEASAAIATCRRGPVDDPFVRYARGCILAASGRYNEARDRCGAGHRNQGQPWVDRAPRPEPGRAVRRRRCGPPCASHRARKNCRARHRRPRLYGRANSRWSDGGRRAQ